MGCTSSAPQVTENKPENKPAHAQVTTVDHAKLAEMSKQLEERDEARLQGQATAKMEKTEKEANQAAAEGIAHQMSASLAEKEIERAQVAGQELKVEQRKGAVESFKGMGAKLRFRAAMKEGSVADALDPGALMVQSAWRAYCARRNAVVKRAEKQRLMEEGLARKLQSLYRSRLARRKAEAKREEKRRLVATESERRAAKNAPKKSASLEDVEVKLAPPEMMKGIIQKEGQLVKSVKPRYFVLRVENDEDSRLTYYAKDIPTEPFGADEKGFVYLKGAVLSDKPAREFMITDKNGRDLKLTFMNPTDKEKWVKAFEAHVSYHSSKK